MCTQNAKTGQTSPHGRHVGFHNERITGPSFQAHFSGPVLGPSSDPGHYNSFTPGGVACVNVQTSNISAGGMGTTDFTNKMESKSQRTENSEDSRNVTVLQEYQEEEEEEKVPGWLFDESQATSFTDWSITNELRFTSETVVRRVYALARLMHDTLTNTGVCYWTSGGTTLGCIRHQGLIPWDDDVDLCIYQKDEGKLKEVKRLLNEKGYDLVEAPSFGYRTFHKSDSERLPSEFQNYRYPFCDIFVMKRTYTKCFIANRCGRTLWPNEFYYNKDIENMEQKPFGAFFLNCPANAEDYLCRTYGEKWRTEGATQFYLHVTGANAKSVKFKLEKVHYQPAIPFN